MKYRLDVYIAGDPDCPHDPIRTYHHGYDDARLGFDAALRHGINVTVRRGNSDVITSHEHYPPTAITKLHILAIQE